jgi:tetraacyldisaccharide 4'-kinase
VNTRWLWYARSPAARLARLPLIPPSLIYRVAVGVRAAAYKKKVLPSREASVPVISVGNLAVGGTGKTPIASWISNWYAAQGLQTGIVLRGYGGDEAGVHRYLDSGALVQETPDRHVGIDRVTRDGAEVVILDDAFQRLDVRRNLNIVLISAEGERAVGWTLPAGPWREGKGALNRCDVVVVTRKSASATSAEDVARGLRESGKPVAVASLQLDGFKGLLTGERISKMEGRSGLVVSGVGNPESFARQVGQTGIRVQTLVFPDHHRYTARDVKKMLHASGGLDYVVVTVKDALKLRPLWPEDQTEPLVADLRVEWESGVEMIETALARGLSNGLSPRGVRKI